MSVTSRASLDHGERTASEPRHNHIHQVVVRNIDSSNPDVRVIQLGIPQGKTIKFLPGQWLDVFTSPTQRPGGFTITSTPAEAEPSQFQPRKKDSIHDPRCDGYLELAIQKSPQNPPAAWLWQPPQDIVGKPLHVRVGGSFVWPLQEIDLVKITRIVFVAGGVGINPLISMTAHITSKPPLHLPHIHFLYTARDAYPFLPERALFLHRLQKCLHRYNGTSTLSLYLTPIPNPTNPIINSNPIQSSSLLQTHRRITHLDLLEALGPEGRRAGTVVYVCGPPNMTDEFVEVMSGAEGMSRERVLCEKWW